MPVNLPPKVELPLGGTAGEQVGGKCSAVKPGPASSCWRQKQTRAMPPSLSGTVLKKRWKLGALVGKGGCAEVYEAIATGGAESAGAGPFVAKVAPLAVGLPPAISKGKKRKKTEQEKHADMIYYEYTLYKGFLADHGGVAEVRTSTRETKLTRGT